jgi:hypothetical protein
MEHERIWSLACSVAAAKARYGAGKMITLEDMQNEAYAAMLSVLAQPDEPHDEEYLRGAAYEAVSKLARQDGSQAKVKRAARLEHCDWIPDKELEDPVERADTLRRAQRIAQIDQTHRVRNRPVKLGGLLLERSGESVTITMPDGSTTRCRMNTVEKALRALLSSTMKP